MLGFYIIEFIICIISLQCFAYMIRVFFKHKEFHQLCYVLLLYSSIGGLIMVTCQMFNSLLAMFKFYHILEYSWICELLAYLSTYGALLMVMFICITINILKSAIVEQNHQDLASNMRKMAICFSLPMFFNIIPLMSDAFIYGSNQGVCWLQYSQGNQKLMVFSLFSFYVPIILISAFSLNDCRIIRKRITQYNTKDRLRGSQDERLEKLQWFGLLPIVYLGIWSINCLIYFVGLCGGNMNELILLKITKILQMGCGVYSYGLIVHSIQFIVIIQRATQALALKSDELRNSLAYNFDFFSSFYLLKSSSEHLLLNEDQNEFLSKR